MRALLLLVAVAFCSLSVLFVSAQSCTGYARQDNCAGNPPLRPDALPACGSFAGPLPANTSAFAVIGDYGLDGQCMSQVAALVLKVQQQFGQLQFIMTAGDNDYWTGDCSGLESGVLQYYLSFLPNATAPSCSNPSLNRPADWVNPKLLEKKEFDDHQVILRAKQMLGEDIDSQAMNDAREQATRKMAAQAVLEAGDNSPIRYYPTLGNHDWTTYDTSPVQDMPYFQVFNYLADLAPPNTGSEGQFYSVQTIIPGVELYSLNSNLGNPSAPPSQQQLFAKQVSWLEQSVKSSTAAFKIVHFHHPPFCTAQHDPLAPWMDLDYEDWGVSLVIAGHEHVYERMVVSRAGSKTGSATTMPYVVNGLGGHPWTYQISNCPIYPGSVFQYNAYHGMQLAIHSWDAQAQSEKIDFCFYSLEQGGLMVDSFELMAGGGMRDSVQTE